MFIWIMAFIKESRNSRPKPVSANPALWKSRWRNSCHPESADKREAAIAKRLNQLTRQFGRLERDLIIHSEAQALFVQYYLTITPQIPIRDQKAARSTGHERFENFITHLGKRLSEGPSLIDKVVNDIKVTEQDFFSIDLDGQNLEKSND